MTPRLLPTADTFAHPSPHYLEPTQAPIQIITLIIAFRMQRPPTVWAASTSLPEMNEPIEARCPVLQKSICSPLVAKPNSR